MTKEEQEMLMQKLAELMYYSSAEAQKKEGGKILKFEKKTEAEKNAFYSLALGFLNNIDKLNFMIVSKAQVKEEKEKRLLFQQKVTQVVTEFFKSIRVFKRELVPQPELIARIVRVWEEL